jgi:ribosomal protein L40E
MDKSLVEETWTCSYCGALNAGYLTKCGKCKTKIKNNDKAI